MTTRLSRIVLALAWVLLLGVVSFLPNRDKRLLHTTGKYHLLGHALAFTVGSLVLINLSRRLSTQLLLLLAAACVAFSLEFTQHLVYHTSLEWLDIAMDLLGLALGFSLIQALRTSTSAHPTRLP